MMFRKLSLAAAVALTPAIAFAQFAAIAPTPPQADSGDRIATTAWVNGLITSGLTLPSGTIWIGSAGNIATPQTPSGDCAISLSGVMTCTKTNGVAFAASATTDTTNATNIASGTLASARGGAGAITGALKGNGAGVVTQAACTDLSNGVASCSTDTTNAANISSGTLAAGRGGAGTINGALKGNGAGVVTQAACADLTNATGLCSGTFNDNTTFTPGIAFGGGTTGITYAFQLGNYSRVGKMICMQVYMQLSNKGSSTGTAAITGLPVSAANIFNSFAILNTIGMTFTGQLQSYVQNSTTAGVYQNNAGTFAALTNTAFANNTDIGIGGCYLTP